MGSFGDSLKAEQDAKKKKEESEGFELLGGTLLVQIAVDPARMQGLYQQIREAAKQGVLDGYNDAAAEIAGRDRPADGASS